MMEPQVNSKHKATRKTRNIIIMVLIGIALLSTLIYLTIPLVSNKIDTNQPDQAQVPDSSLQETQAEQSKVIEKPVEKKEVKPNSFNLTGRWLTDENLEWRIVQSGDKVEITRYNKRGNPTIVEGRINGNTLSYRKKKAGNDLEGKFTISKDGNSLDGVEYKAAGRNRLKITRIH